MKSENVRLKMREADFFFQCLVKNAQAVVNSEPEEFLFHLSAFLSAADALRNLLSRRGFKWSDWPDPEEQNLLTFMREQRRLVVHVEGNPDVEIDMEYLPYEGDATYRGMRPPVAHVWFGPPGMTPPHIGQRTYSFKMEGDEEKAVVVCRRYLELLGKLVKQFG